MTHKVDFHIFHLTKSCVKNAPFMLGILNTTANARRFYLFFSKYSLNPLTNVFCLRRPMFLLTSLFLLLSIFTGYIFTIFSLRLRRNAALFECTSMRRSSYCGSQKSHAHGIKIPDTKFSLTHLIFSLKR